MPTAVPLIFQEPHAIPFVKIWVASRLISMGLGHLVGPCDLDRNLALLDGIGYLSAIGYVPTKSLVDEVISSIPLSSEQIHTLLMGVS